MEPKGYRFYIVHTRRVCPGLTFGLILLFGLRWAFCLLG